MIEIDDSIYRKGLFRRLLPCVPDDLHKDFCAAALDYSYGDRRSSSVILKRATKDLEWKEKIRVLLIFSLWSNVVDSPLMVLAGIFAVPFALLALVSGWIK
jgi:membrane protein YqaA with SNARE-associated domain